MTDALEMKAISATVGVEEGAVRAIAAGADALCLGHDLFDESVAERSRRARRGGSLGAASRGAARRGGGAGRGGRRLGVRARRRRAGDRDAGRQRHAARSRCDGRGAARRGPPLVVELEPEPGMAAGRLSQTAGRVVRGGRAGCRRSSASTRAPSTPTSRSTAASSSSSPATRIGTHGSARRSTRLTARAPDAIVVEIGLPHWRPPALRPTSRPTARPA